MVKRKTGSRGRKAAFALALVLALVMSCASAFAGTVNVRVELEYRYDMTEPMLEIINAFRTGDTWMWNNTNTEKIPVNGREPLIYDYGLERTAMLRAAECAVIYGHTRPNEKGCFTAYPEGMGALGENIAAGQRSMEQVFNAWRENQGHRRNMLNKEYTHIGIGCVYADGTYYWCQVFAKGSTGESKSALKGPAVVEATEERLKSDEGGTNQGMTGLKIYAEQIKVREGESLPVLEVSGKSRGWGATFITLTSVPWRSADESVAKVEQVSEKQWVVTGGKAGRTVLNYGSEVAKDGKDLTMEVVVTCKEHTWNSGTVTKAPTCTESGSRDVECTVCGEKGTLEIEPLGHDWGKTTYTWARDFSTVTARRTCERDGEHVETETVKLAESEILKEPTNEEEGEGIFTSEAFRNKAFEKQSGRMRIPRLRTPGDVNEDGEVDGRDAVHLMKWLAHEDDVTEINQDNADVDGSGKVDEKDLLRLMRFLAGEEGVELI